MTENNVVAFKQEGAIDDPLMEILRSGAKRLIEQAVEAEFAAFLAQHGELKLPDGRQRVVRHGHDPVRAIQTGVGPVEVEKELCTNLGDGMVQAADASGVCGQSHRNRRSAAQP